MRHCGIDFGTSNSTLGLADGSGARLLPLERASPTLPSAVFWAEDGPPQFGQAAIAAYLEHEEGRLMRALKSTLGSGLIHERTRVGNRTVAFREVLGRFLAHLASRLPNGPEAVVMGRPVHFVDDDPALDAQAEATLGEIARDLGFREVSFQFEPIAAARDHESRCTTEELVLIFDIGGGTSDVSLVRVGPDRARRADRADDILGNDGIRLGGTDFDRMLSLAEALPHLGFGAATKGGAGTMPRHYFLDLATWHRINQLYSRSTMTDLKALRHEIDNPELIDRLIRLIEGRQGHALAMEVERVKIALSDTEAERLLLRPLCGAPNPVVRREAFEQTLAPALTRLRDLITRVLAQGGVTPAEVGTVFVTGGSSRLPLLRRLVQDMLPQAQLHSGDDFGAVGLGLALEARHRYT
ncbi:putative chaperone protein [Gemmobacter caeni]|uniref:Putative chaperone protein n=1 Tax=Gemmobacter caeni TaxID=589035 RepID=A0A2T6APM5_9RHOB|nr:Hsp70 family protein [Gemmobacter caeni]PTX45771.1 putative chaperone protein [Gemmobacter caeni]TWI94076.1 putative chaperone protein [Gemmobacter caeni]